MKKTYITLFMSFMLVASTIIAPGLFNQGGTANSSLENEHTTPINSKNIDVSLTINAFNPPIIIPNLGGNFGYAVEATNNNGTPLTFDIWTTYTYPNSTISIPLYGPVQFLLQNDWATYREDLTQQVQSDLPSGDYTYSVHIGNYESNMIWETDQLTFQKLGEGASWYQQVPGIDETLNAVDFADSEHGWAVGYGTIMHTDDGGDTWYQQDDELYYNTDYDAVDFIDNQTGWIAGGKILKTTNGGMNWTEQYDPSGYTINAIQFLDENNGWAAGGIIDTYNQHFRRVIKHTSDGGETWETQLYESGYYYYDYIEPLYDIYMLDMNTGWAVGSFGAVFHTTDGGSTWIEQRLGGYPDLFGVVFTDMSTGWAVGEDGTVIASEDGGITWTNISIGSTDDLNSIVFTDSSNGWIAGGGYDPYHGIIYHTSNAGVTWNLQNTGTGEEEYYLNDIAFIDETMGWTSGGTWYPWEGVMLHTENGGGDPVFPELAYTPTMIDFGDMYGAQEDSRTVNIWNNGTGNLNYYFYPESACTWITVSPESGFSSGETDEINVTIDTLGLQPGEYTCNLTVTSNVGTYIIPINVTILESNQTLSYDPLYHDFGEVAENQLVTTNLSIWNSGTGTMFYWIDDSGTFCVVEPWSGSSQGEVNNHTIMCFTSGLDPGFHQCNLTIHAGTNQTGNVTINVTVVDDGNKSATFEKTETTTDSLNMNISVGINPHQSPIYVAASGGAFLYTIETTNNEANAQTFDIWTTYTYPNNTISDHPLYGPMSFTLQPGWSAYSNDLSQYVTEEVPSGEYSYTSHVGIQANDSSWNSDSFPFTKVTEDTGWYQQVPGIDETLNAVDFADSEHGWAVGYGTIMHTDDGGDTWYQQDDELYYNTDYDAVDFIDNQTGWIAGGKILKTTNGGMNWTEQYDPSGYTINAIQFLDENNGWAAGGIIDTYNQHFRRVIKHTSDGGETWETQLYESGYYYYDYIEPLYDIYMLDMNTGWAVGSFGAVFHTTDGGSTWIEQRLGGYPDLFGVVFTDMSTGWAVGEDGTVIASEDGGITWTNISIGSTDDLNSIVFTDSSNGWIAGGGYEPIHSNIYHTKDGGITWALQDMTTDDNEFILNDLCIIDSTQGWATGGTWYPWEGVMLHTENGGGNPVFPELAYTPSAIDFGEMYGAQEDSRSFTIWNNGTGTLSYSLSPEAECTWITVTPDSGFSTGEQDNLTITIGTLGLQPGQYQCNITITTNDETTTMPVSVTINESDQILYYNPEYINFGEMEQYQMETMNLSIQNIGTGTMFYWTDDAGTFCVVEPWSGSSQGEMNNHTVRCFTSGLEPGFHETNLTIYAGTNQTGNVTIAVTVVEGNDPIEDTNQSEFDRGFPIRHASDGDWAGAQNFTVTTNFTHMSEIYIRKFGTPEFNLTVQLRTESPIGPILDTLTFTPDEIPSTWTWLELDFQDQIITEETDYYIVTPPAPEGVTTSFGYEWGYAFGDQYDGGSFWFTRDGGELWRALPMMYEFDFKTIGYN